MKKYLLLLFLFLTVSLIQAQPGLPGACICCEDYLGPDDEETPEYIDCVTDCYNGDDFTYCDPVVPIDTNIVLLFVLGISFGTYSIYQINKKRQLEK